MTEDQLVELVLEQALGESWGELKSLTAFASQASSFEPWIPGQGPG